MEESRSEIADTSQIRSEVSAAMATLDEELITDALVDALEQLFDPFVIAGFLLEPGQPLHMQRLVADAEWRNRLAGSLGFEWMEPILGVDVPNGASLLGPDMSGACQMAAAITTGDGRYAYILIAGEFADAAGTERRFAEFARESGEAFAAIKKANEHGADLAAIRERERLSRDLHDSLSQSLWSLSMLSETAHASLDPDDPLQDTLRRIAEISLSSQEEMRSLLINLRSVEPAHDTIGGALESLIADFRSRHDIEVLASIAEVDITAEEALAFRRITEEALNNVGRHAHASSVTVLLDALPSPTLRIVDDGVGFDAKPRDGHLGLKIMRERSAGIGCEFDVSSGPDGGTVVTVARDAASATPLPRIRRPIPPKRRIVRPLLAGVLCLLIAFGASVVAWARMTDASAFEGDLDELAVLDRRVQVARASVDEATIRILQGVGAADTDDVVRATAFREVTLVRATEAMQELSDEGSVRALRLLDDIAGLDDLGESEPRLRLLFTGARAMEPGFDQRPPEATRPLDSLMNLAALDQAITFGLHESLAARYAMGSPNGSIDPEVQDFLVDVAETVETSGGYLGPSPAVPLRDGYFPTAMAAVHERDALAGLNRIVAAAGVWTDDQWLRDWDRAAEPPPMELPDYLDSVDAATAEARALIDSRIEDRRASMVAEAGDARRQSHLLFALAAGLVGLAGVLLWRAFAEWRRRSGAIERSKTTDQRTGLVDRRSFEEQVTRQLDDPLREHHVLALIDLDRFKFINDVHGREVGDRMLEAVAVGLGAIRTHDDRYVGVVGRLGPDEFAISFHGTESLPIELLQRALNRLRSTQISAPDGSMVRCNFSYGISVATGSPDVRSMLVDAELQVYEAKDRLKA